MQSKLLARDVNITLVNILCFVFFTLSSLSLTFIFLFYMQKESPVGRATQSADPGNVVNVLDLLPSHYYLYGHSCVNVM